MVRLASRQLRDVAVIHARPGATRPPTGVQWRLLVAFLGICAFTMLAATAGMYAFRQVAGVLERITEQRAPGALAALELSRQAERIVAAAPALLTVRSQAQRQQASATITAEVRDLGKLLSEIKERSVDAGALALIEAAVEGLHRNLDALDGLMAHRLEIADQREELLGRLAAATVAAQRLVSPGILVMDSRIEVWRRIVAGEPTDPDALTELVQGIAANLPMLKAQIEFTALADGLLKASSAAVPTELPLLTRPLQRSLAALREILDNADQRLRPSFERLVEDFAGLVDGAQSLPEVRRTELGLVAEGERLLAENAALSKRLTRAVDTLVAAAGGDIRTASKEAFAVQRFGAEVLLAVAALSLLSSGLIVWLYVHRNLLARLTALSQSMLAIAGGNLRAPVPGSRGRDEIDHMAEALAVFRDTAVEVEEKNLHEVANARRRLIDAIESISDGFALYDADDRLVLSNRWFLRDSGAEELAKPGTSFETIVRWAADCGLVEEAKGDPEAWVAARLAAHRNPGEPLIVHDGNRWLRISERRLQNGGIVAIHTDISELKRREVELADLVQKLRATRDEAMRATQAKSRFLANMSHELRTPLNAIIGFSRLVMRRAKDVLPVTQYENLQKILVSSEHLLALINTILDLSKIEAGHTDVSPRAFELEPLLELCCTTVQPLLKAGQVWLLRDVQRPLPTFFTDEEKLKQILLNLLSNAAKFTEAGSITLSARDLEGCLELSVVDTGIGIPRGSLATIFEEFHQVEGGAGLAHSGTGLGLAISRRLARMLGGDIAVTSEEGKGSTFAVTIPIRLASPPEVPKAKPQESKPAVVGLSPRPRDKLVLAIDDDPNVAYLLNEDLADAGYRVIGAADGEEGLQKARELRPRVITLDIIMPGIDGWQVLHTLKADAATRDIPVIVVSIVDQKGLGFRLGAADYLVKPFDRETLIGAIGRVAPQGLRILVVDDDPNVAEIVRQSLEGESYTIDSAPDGAAGLERIAQIRPSMILLDLLMPRMDGFAFLDALGEDAAHSDIPVIVLTAKCLTDEDRRRLDERVLGLIEKRHLDRQGLIQEIRCALLLTDQVNADGKQLTTPKEWQGQP